MHLLKGQEIQILVAKPQKCPIMKKLESKGVQKYHSEERQPRSNCKSHFKKQTFQTRYYIVITFLLSFSTVVILKSFLQKKCHFAGEESV